MNPLLLTDYYKTEHYRQYPKGTTLVYSNLTPRKSRLPGIDDMVFVGIQYVIKEYLIKAFNEEFFRQPLKKVIEEYKRHINVDTKHLEALWYLGYLPIEIKALPEGSIVPMRVPCLTIKNTLPEFFWLVNYLETLLSNVLWQACTSATIAHEYKKIFTKALKDTIGDTEFVQWMGHDFSMRGMSSIESSILSGIGHLTSFTGTDTIPAIYAAEKYYGATGLIGASVPATEHSVMCAGTGVDGEFETFKRLITEIYPSGIISIVSDTFNLWDVLTKFMPKLKDEIMARDGKVVIRPDSGDPVDIICGVQGAPYKNANFGDYTRYFEEHNRLNESVCTEQEFKGVIELLWDVFGGTVVNGYKVLDPHVGAIYGDSISLERAQQITDRLKTKGFAPILVYGIGSYSYQYNTRDTFGMAIKATYIEVNGKGIEIFKDPITDDGTKKSAKGLLAVSKDIYNNLYLKDQCTWEEEKSGYLDTVFLDGKLVKKTNLEEIRQRLNKQQ